MPARQLIEALWDRPTRNPESNLRTHVAALRRALAKISPELRGRVVTHSKMLYSLDIRSGELDAMQFAMLSRKGRAALSQGDLCTAAELLREALALWRGPAGVDVRTSEYLDHRLGILDEQHMATIEDLADVQIALGAFPEAIEALRWLLSDNPLRERAWSALIRAQYLVGDTSGALSTYEQARKTIRDELGSDPSPGMRLMHEAILRHDAEILRLGNLALAQ
ncbi:hypothetical protein GCM10010116_45220 [Microbispora rosea subsp. aerata]|nr:hypothetical protein GCM10010116_45220 [Microbispora rosea subsp. aerata]GIH57447.1 hypothetical protein Mro02_43610 [Microbispora rosea subsp. aerata]GLJ86398.1 hypothetical protein GCM10017588_51350 [Microbispora rosea subsp. aerata]